MRYISSCAANFNSKITFSGLFFYHYYFFKAQFNIPADRLSAATANATTNADANATSTATTTSAGTGSASATTTAAPSAQAPHQPTVNIRSFPFIPGASMRMQSFPIEFRTASGRAVNVTVGPRNNTANNNNNSSGTDAAGGTTAPTTATTVNSGAAQPTASNTQDNPFNMPNFNNSGVEFFVEVTPEGE